MDKSFRHLMSVASFVLGVLFLGACASGPVLTVSEEDISAAQDVGELEALYENIKGQLSGLDPEKHRADFARLTNVGKRLAEASAVALRGQLEDAQLSSGLVPKNVLERAAQQAIRIQGWNRQIGSELATDILASSKATQMAIAKALDERAMLAEDQYRERISVLDGLVALTGNEQYVAERDNLVRSVSEQAVQAQAAENLEQAKTLLDALPDTSATRQQRALVDRKLFEKRFNQALADNKPDQAYQHFAALAAASNWEDIKPSLVDTGEVMVAYFTTLASDATDQKKLADAHRWFSQAYHLEKALGLNQLADGSLRVKVEPFLKKILVLADKTRGKSELKAQELGLLYIVNRLDPGRPDIVGRVRELRGKIAANAPREVSTTVFRDPAGDYKFGDKIAAGITQYLFQSIPHDVRIIEREQYDAIKREQDLRGKSSLSSVDFLITGSVLEAKVESTQQNSRRTMRVVTETGTRSNPAYLEWLKLTEDQQDRIAQPPQTESFEKREDITVNLTIHRKVGIFSVSYRMIDARSGKVLFPDSVMESVEFSDESTEGVQLGDFTQEFKLAELPSDVEILNGLAAKISASIGKKLTDRLKDQENYYQHNGELKLEAGRYHEALELLATAESLAQSKGKDTKALEEQIAKVALIAATDES